MENEQPFDVAGPPRSKRPKNTEQPDHCSSDSEDDLAISINNAILYHLDMQRVRSERANRLVANELTEFALAGEVISCDMSLLQPGQMLTSSILDLVGLILQHKHPFVKCIAIGFVVWTRTTIFLRKSWIPRVVPTEVRFMLAPVNVDDNHWTLLVIDFALRMICYLDSLDSRASKERDENLLELVRVCMIERDQSIDTGESTNNRAPWTVQRTRCPQQEGGVDCGVFVCYFMSILALKSGGQTPVDRLLQSERIFDTVIYRQRLHQLLLDYKV
jgi:hypothetical protein